jgi:hypothetical protein
MKKRIHHKGTKVRKERAQRRYKAFLGKKDALVKKGAGL